MLQVARCGGLILQALQQGALEPIPATISSEGVAVLIHESVHKNSFWR